MSENNSSYPNNIKTSGEINNEKKNLLNKFDTVEIEKNKVLNELFKHESILNSESSDNHPKNIKKTPRSPKLNMPDIDYDRPKATQMTLPDIDIKSFDIALKQAKKDFRKYEKKPNDNKINPEGKKVQELLEKVNRKSRASFDINKPSVQNQSQVKQPDIPKQLPKTNITADKKTSSDKNENGFFKNLFSYDEYDDGEQYYEPEILKKRETIEDYNSPEDTASIKKDLSAQLKFSLIKFIMCVIICIPLFVYNIAIIFKFPFIPENILPQNNPAGYFMFNAAALALLIMINSQSVISGIVNLFKFKADYNSLPALSACLCLINDIILIFISQPTASKNNTYNISFSFIAGIILLVNMLGKLYAVNNIKGNFKLIALQNKKSEKNVAILNSNSDINRKFENNYFDSSEKLVYSRKADFVTGFLDKSYSVKSIDKKGRIWIYISLTALVISCVYLFASNHSISSVISIISFMLLLITPLSSSGAIWMPFCKFSGRLRRQGVALLGSNSISDFKDTGAVLLRDSDILNNNNITISGIKVFPGTRIDKMLILLASIFVESKSILSDVFMKILDNNKSMLQKCDKIKMIPSQGIAARIGSQKIICGNKKMLDKIGISIPDGYEKMNKCGRYVMYLAADYNVIGVFAVNYNINPKISRILSSLYKQGISMFIKTSDPNISEEFFRDVFNIPHLITILDNDKSKFISEIFKPSERISSSIVSLTGTRGILYTLAAMNKISNCVTMSAVLRNLSIVIGAVLSLIIVFGSVTSAIVPITILIFQCIWSLPIFIIYLNSK